MKRTVWPSLVNGVWYLWKPLPGLEPGLDESVLWLASAKWASCMASGKPETKAHQEAEQFIFETVYGVSYPTSIANHQSKLEGGRK